MKHGRHGLLGKANGRLALKSVKGKGTTVDLWFPRDP
ncbi:MAG: signal transduction histidine kinase [Limimaricola cinnabarinus]|jgi:signal transduction histidine kinase